MDEQSFWEIVEQNAGNAKAIAAELAKLPLEEIATWHRMYYDLHNALHRAEMWDVADIIYNNLFAFPSSDDSFHYFKAWVIGKGRETYQAILGNPDALGRFVTPDDLRALCDNESLNYAAEHAWEAKGRNCDELDRKSNEGETPVGERCDPAGWSQKYPMMVSRFGPCRW